MYNLKNPEVHASEIAELLGSELLGADCVVTTPATPATAKDNSFVFSEFGSRAVHKRLKGRNSILVIANIADAPPVPGMAIVVVPDPRAAFVRIVNELFLEMEKVRIADSAAISSEATVGRGVSIGENVVIKGIVEIGNNSTINNNVVICGPTRIGTNCYIRDNTTIGGDAFDFLPAGDDLALQVPHIGGIEIGDRVWIGSNVSIERGVFDWTAIQTDAKIDDLVQIGAGCNVGSGALIMAGSILGRDVTVGAGARIAPNSSVRENLSIGADALIGLGSVVVKDVTAGTVCYGNPARTRDIRAERG
jgi:UDP-3-O-[3-hydroxymyristoyl] glucosamine N-acyltransferase LpxD